MHLNENNEQFQKLSYFDAELIIFDKAANVIKSKSLTQTEKHVHVSRTIMCFVLVEMTI